MIDSYIWVSLHDIIRNAGNKINHRRTTGAVYAELIKLKNDGENCTYLHLRTAEDVPLFSCRERLNDVQYTENLFSVR